MVKVPIGQYLNVAMKGEVNLMHFPDAVKQMEIDLKRQISEVGMFAIQYGCPEKMPKQIKDFDLIKKSEVTGYAGLLIESDDLWKALETAGFTRTAGIKGQIQSYNTTLKKQLDNMAD
jgi:hypothetical protein